MLALTPARLAWRLARDLPPAATVWFGEGLPQDIPAHCPGQRRALRPQDADIAIITATQVDVQGAVVAAAGGTLPATLWVISPFWRDDGLPTLVEQCSHSVLPGARATRLYSEIAVFDLAAGQATLRALDEGITLLTLQMELDIDLQVSPDLVLLQMPATPGGHY